MAATMPKTVPDEVEPLLIEANMAFGTGHHGTTKGCLLAFDALLDAGLRPKTVADIGCGTAVLAMAAARVLPDAARIIASDIDQVAVEVAEANLLANGLPGRVTCIEATGTDHPGISAAAPFDLIFANILMGPLIALAPDIARGLRRKRARSCLVFSTSRRKPCWRPIWPKALFRKTGGCWATGPPVAQAGLSPADTCTALAAPSIKKAAWRPLLNVSDTALRLQQRLDLAAGQADVFQLAVRQGGQALRVARRSYQARTALEGGAIEIAEDTCVQVANCGRAGYR